MIEMLNLQLRVRRLVTHSKIGFTSVVLCMTQVVCVRVLNTKTQNVYASSDKPYAYKCLFLVVQIRNLKKRCVLVNNEKQEHVNVPCE